MFKYFLKRLAQMLVTLFIVSVLVFVLANFIGQYAGLAQGSA